MVEARMTAPRIRHAGSRARHLASGLVPSKLRQEVTDAEMKLALRALSLRRGATPAQAEELAQIAFDELAKGVRVEAILTKLGMDIGD